MIDDEHFLLYSLIADFIFLLLHRFVSSININFLQIFDAKYDSKHAPLVINSPSDLLIFIQIRFVFVKISLDNLFSHLNSVPNLIRSV